MAKHVQDAAGAAKKRVTLLEGGIFARGRWGWQFTGEADSGDYARYFVLGPERGNVYAFRVDEN